MVIYAAKCTCTRMLLHKLGLRFNVERLLICCAYKLQRKHPDDLSYFSCEVACVTGCINKNNPHGPGKVKGKTKLGICNQ